MTRGALIRAGAAVVAIAVALLPACTVGGERSEADRLRNELRDTRAALEAVRRERVELTGKVNELAAALRAATEGGSPSAAVVAALPRVAALEIDRYSALVDRDDRPGFEAIDVYVMPRDGRDRFTQAAGALRVRVTREAEAIGDPPTELVAVTLGPAELREAYRETLFSTHYAVNIPLDPPVRLEDDPTNFRPITIHARLDDAITGLTHTTTKTLTQ